MSSTMEALDAVMAPPLPHNNGLVVSGVMGSISIAFWIIVFTPQIYENYKRKSSEGLSTAFILIWLVGDLFNLFGAVLQHVLPTMIILAAYYTFADLILFVQCLIYQKNSPVQDAERAVSNAAAEISEQTGLLTGQRSTTSRHKEALVNFGIVLCVVLFGVVGYFLSSHNDVGPAPGEQPLNLWGQLLGWICALLYLASRVPQIKLNYDRKSTDGTSLLFFIFAVLGNLTYVWSILAADSSRHALLVNASWLTGSVGTLFLDFIIFAQFIVYRQ